MIDVIRHPASFRRSRKTWSDHFELGETPEKSDLNLQAALAEFAQGLDHDRVWSLLLSAALQGRPRLQPGSLSVLVVATSWYVSYSYVRNHSFNKLSHRVAIDKAVSELTLRTAGMPGALDADLYERIATDAWIFHHEHLGAGRAHGGC